METGPVRIDGRTDRPRGVVQEKFTSLVEDERGSHWVTIRALVKRAGLGRPERLIQMNSENKQCSG